MSATVRSVERFEDRSWRNPTTGFEVILIAASAGGIMALREILGSLPAGFPLPVLIAQHRSGLASCDRYVEILRYFTKLEVKVAEEGEEMRAGTIYVPPGGRHLALTGSGTLSVKNEGRIRYLCPSADLLFETAAQSHGERALALVLSGSGRDGAQGLLAVRRAGGFVIAQDEASSEYFEMPHAAIETCKVDLVLGLHQIAFALCILAGTTDVPMRAPCRSRVAA